MAAVAGGGCREGGPASAFFTDAADAEGGSEGPGGGAEGGHAEEVPADLVLLLQAPEPEYGGDGFLSREVVRQAVLIAARDGLGLRTRDMSLLEYPSGTAATAYREGAVESFVFRVPGDGRLLVDLNRAGTGRASAQHDHAIEVPVAELATLVSKAEELSRGGFVETLRSLGFETPAGAEGGHAAVEEPPAERVGRFDLVSQYAAVRGWHAAVAAEGETPERLAGLARGYANLGLLARPHVSTMRKAWQARSLLYAERLLRQGETPAAYRVRAYARALAELPGAAGEDLARAEAAGKDEAPGWAEVIEAYVSDDGEALAGLAAEGQGPDAVLAALLDLNRAQLGGRDVEIEAAANVLSELAPACNRGLDALIARGMPLGVMREAQAAALEPPADWLYEPLAASGLGLTVGAGEGDDAELEGIARSQFTSELTGRRFWDDAGEPSLATLGRLVEDEGLYRGWRVTSIDVQAVNVEADEYVEMTSRWAPNHPFRGLIGSLAWEDRGTAVQDLSNALWAGRPLPSHEPVLVYLEGISRDVSRSRAKAMRNADATADDLAWRIDKEYDLADRRRLARRLARVAPSWGAAAVRSLRHDPDRTADKLGEWEKAFAGNPDVLTALADRHVEGKRYEDAVRLLAAAAEASPGYEAFLKLAEVRLEAGDEAGYFAALREFLDYPSGGLEPGQAADKIARRHMRAGRWEEALPYARFAAATYSGWGLACEADCREGMGDFAAAERLHAAVSERYRGSAHDWYFWCLRTGQGDAAAARGTAEEQFAEWERNHHAEDYEYLRRLAFVDHAEGRLEEALGRYRELLKAKTTAYDALMIALLADQLGKTGERDESLAKAVELGRATDLAVAWLAGAFVADLAGTPLDVKAAEAEIRRTAVYTGAATNHTYFLAWHLENRGRKEEAVPFYERAAASPAVNRFACPLSAVALRRLGRDVPPQRPDEIDAGLTRARELMDRAYEYSRNERYAAALDRTDAALAAVPGLMAATSLRADLLLGVERFDEAVAAYTAILAQDATRLDARLMRGQALERAGRHAEAIEDYKAVAAAETDVDTKNSGHNNLAWMYAACVDPAVRDPEAALREIGQVEVTEYTPEWLKSRARAAALAAAGRTEEAARLVEETLPQNPEADWPVMERRLATYRARRPYVRPERWWRQTLDAEE